MRCRRMARLVRVGALCALGTAGCTWDWERFRAPRPDDGSVSNPDVAVVDRDAAGPPMPLGVSDGRWELDMDESCEGAQLDRQRWLTQYIRSERPFDHFDWAGSWAANENVTVSDGLCRIRVEERTSPKDPKQVIATGVLSSRMYHRPPAFIEVRMRGLRGVGLSTVAQLSSSVGYPPQLDIARIEGKDPTGPELLFFYATTSNTTGSYRITFPSPRPDLSEDFHVYGFEWRTDKIVVYRDGVRSPMQVPANVADRTLARGPLQIEITVHTGPGDFMPEKPTPPAIPAEVLIDYVRIWKER